MANIGVRRLGMAPCTEIDYKVTRKRERLIREGNDVELKKFDEALAKKKIAEVEKKTEGENE